MRRLKILISFTLILAHVYISIFTKYSLTGFWTDLIVFIIAVTALQFFVFKSYRNRKTSLISWSTICLITTLFLFIKSPFYLDHFKMKSFLYQNVNGRMFNAYFKPVGSYSGGEGNFWITESPKYFPMLEKLVHYEHSILWDFRPDEWDGQKVNQRENVRSYILREVIDK